MAFGKPVIILNLMTLSENYFPEDFYCINNNKEDITKFVFYSINNNTSGRIRKILYPEENNREKIILKLVDIYKSYNFLT